MNIKSTELFQVDGDQVTLLETVKINGSIYYKGRKFHINNCIGGVKIALLIDDESMIEGDRITSYNIKGIYKK